MNATKQKIFDYVEANLGKRLSAYVVSRANGMSQKIAHNLLRELVADGLLKTSEPGKITLFYVPTAADIEAAQHQHYVPPFKPYRQIGAAWDVVADRLNDFRAIKSLIRSTP